MAEDLDVLERQCGTTECPECGRWRLFRHDWEAVSGGALRFFYSEECAACGHFETNGDW